jgi:tRNA pseudouridine32 synthase/23S rRNA pseudouridine746 synthase
MLELVMENQNFMVVNKPIGMPMHDSEKAIIPIAESQFNCEKLWLIHRLDTDTSGCLLLAKNQQAASNLSQQFAAKTIQKYYIALIDHKPKKKQGMIKGDMKKVRKGYWKLTTGQENPAITQFFSFSLQVESAQSAASIPNDNSRDKHLLQPAMRICLLKPLTGKTHQIRVALRSLGSPIVGDKRYKGSESDRMYLHSYAMKFHYQNEPFEISCLPKSGALIGHIHAFLAKQPLPWLMQWPTAT